MPTESRVADILGLLQTTTGSTWSNQPWDGLQTGSMDAAVKGVAVAWAPKLAVLKQAVQKQCNLILTKDPVYWCEKLPAKSPDGLITRATEGPGGPAAWAEVEKTDLYKIKKNFIESNNLNIYRIAQNWSGSQSRPTAGLLSALGWKADQTIRVENSDPNLKTAIVTVPQQSFLELAKYAKNRVGGKSVRLLGEVNARVTKVALHPGYLTIGAIPRIAETANLRIADRNRRRRARPGGLCPVSHWQHPA